MLRLLIPTGSGYTWVEHSPPAPFPDEFLWADLFEPTVEEEKAVESLLTVDVPTRDEMREIETSNRLYEEDGAVYMTATVGSKLDSATPESSAITFILANNRLITNRYVDPTPVRRFMTHVERSPGGLHVVRHAAGGPARGVRRAHRGPARARAGGTRFRFAQHLPAVQRRDDLRRRPASR